MARKRKKQARYRPPSKAEIVALAKALHRPSGIRPHGGSRAYGMHHDSRKVNVMSIRAGGRSKTLRVAVKVSRTGTGHFFAIACVAGMKSPYLGKGSHCSGGRGGTTPTKAAANAMTELAESLHKYGR